MFKRFSRFSCLHQQSYSGLKEMQLCDNQIMTSFSAAGIFFCFLVKEKAPDLIGESDVEAQRSPEGNHWITLNTHSLTLSQCNANAKRQSTHCSPVVWQSSGHTLGPAGSSGTPGSTCWRSMPDTPPVAHTVTRPWRWACTINKTALEATKTFPQARQWCLRQVRVNSQVQIMHMVALRSGIQIGALEPNGAPLSTTTSPCVGGQWKWKFNRLKLEFWERTWCCEEDASPPPDSCWIWRWSSS